LKELQWDKKRLKTMVHFEGKELRKGKEKNGERGRGEEGGAKKKGKKNERGKEGASWAKGGRNVREKKIPSARNKKPKFPKLGEKGKKRRWGRGREGKGTEGVGGGFGGGGKPRTAYSRGPSPLVVTRYKRVVMTK